MKSYENGFNKLNQQEKRLNFIRKQVDTIVDKIGTPVDKGIKETIAVFMAMDFTTSSSCAGHTNEKEGYGAPYVEFYTAGPEGWKEDKQKQQLWKDENLIQKEKLLHLLSKFYQARDILDDVKLNLKDIGIFGGFRLQSTGVSKTKVELGIKTQENVVDKIKLYQKEMQDFTLFLLREYLTNKQI